MVRYLQCLLAPHFEECKLIAPTTPRPDLCDGSYPTYCNSAPQYHNIIQILTTSGNTDLLTYMEEYWQPNSGTLEHFWQHEWNKHGTCVNTLAPSCYGEGYQAGDEVVDYFAKAVEVFQVRSTSHILMMFP